MSKYRLFGLPTEAISNREENHRKLAREMATEGMVLLKNDGILPLKDKRVALFGVGARKTVKGGSGGGEVHERFSVTIEQGLQQNGFVIENSLWMDRYDEHFEKVRTEWKASVEAAIKGFSPLKVVQMFDVIHTMPFRWPSSIPVLPSDLNDASTAIYVLARQAGEGVDRTLAKGDWLLHDSEIADIRLLASSYPHLIVVINCGGFIDLSPLDEISNIGALIHFVQGGEEGGNALADLLSGKVTPSGKLVDTWARCYEDYPSYSTFGNVNGHPEVDEYKEGIFVGYRHFDAFNIAPRFPFGFGLSYTTFSLKAEAWKLHETTLSMDVLVKNTGNAFSGKEVVQLYLSKPQGALTKEVVALASFAKSDLLAPGAKQHLMLTLDLLEHASFDETTASWILEKGEYGIFLGNSSKNLTPVVVVNLKDTVVTEKAVHICPVINPFEEVLPHMEGKVYPKDCPRLELDASLVKTRIVSYEAPKVSFKNEETRKLFDRLSIDQRIDVCIGGGYSQKVYNITSGVAGKTSVNLLRQGIPNLNMADGPSGLFVMPKNAYTRSGSPRYVDELPSDWQWGWLKKFQKFVLAKPGKGKRAFHFMTAFPAPNLQAQSWNVPLVEKVGKAIGVEMLESGITFWLAPGMNIHRNPLCGRNFEYYSEDPHISGVMAASVSRGVQSHGGIGACLKHLCCNNQEDRREYVTENIHERALREIYLRNFRIALQRVKPWSIMTSYNQVNGVYTANSHDLCTKVLRNEFGFEGLVMSDWNATESDKGSSTLCLPSGNDLIMPGSKNAKKAVLDGLKNDQISVTDLNRCAANVLNAISQSAVYQLYVSENPKRRK